MNIEHPTSNQPSLKLRRAGVERRTSRHRQPSTVNRQPSTVIYDIVIRGGTLVTPEKVFPGDLGISGEKIAAVGVNLSGREEIDATGKLVLPGVIDGHTHLDTPIADSRT
ncbi:MAG: hypothetical protein U9N73_08930, partial [Candidatus Auribacterota bacterium]|nr:hypothetical protein [Candidatus Auribacterota bacterium]